MVHANDETLATTDLGLDPAQLDDSDDGLTLVTLILVVVFVAVLLDRGALLASLPDLQPLIFFGRLITIGGLLIVASSLILRGLRRATGDSVARAGHLVAGAVLVATALFAA